MRKLLLVMSAFLLSIASFASSPLWMRYPSISPDGMNIAFEYQGDVFVVPTSGGQARAITNHVAYDFSPIWSPDGKSIAFASDRHGNFDIYLTSINGGTPKRITYNSASEIPSSFTPDGKNILFSAQIMDNVKSAEFPYPLLTELYSVPIEGGRVKQILTTTAEYAQYNKDMSKILYQDRKGYENRWRKHHTSSVTRDLWLYDTNTKKHTKISNFKGEDRTPVYYNNYSKIAYTSEVDSTLNVWTMNADGSNKKQITKLSKFPVRFLTAANNNTFCYGWNGEIYTLKEGSQPQKVKISIIRDDKSNEAKRYAFSRGGHDISVSPDGKEVAFILRGNVFVTSADYSTTVQITDTPEQERSVNFSPDGRSIAYASERNGSWNIYISKLANKDENNFVYATDIKEEVLTDLPEEEFTPKWSPKGDEIAYLSKRTAIKVINVKSKKRRTVLDGKFNYSYSDGDQNFEWSPDGKWIACKFSPHNWAITDIGLIDASGKKGIINITESGYNESNPHFAMGGKVLIYNTEKYGYRSHGSWGAETDVMAAFLTRDAYDEFTLSKEDYQLLLQNKRSKAKSLAKAKKEDAKAKKKEDKKVEKKGLQVDVDHIKDRIERLTINSSFLSDYILTNDGSKLYYLSRFEGGYDLWLKDIRQNQTKLVMKLSGGGGNFQSDRSGRNIFFETGGSITKLAVGSNRRSFISYRAEFDLNRPKERDYLFEHVWRQVLKKFYDPNMNGADWTFYKKAYSKFLPYINNNYDFAEMLSEMLGELNGSHTGCRYSPSLSSYTSDITASFCAFYNPDYKGDGLLIDEVIEGSPLSKIEDPVTAGMYIRSINGKTIKAGEDYYKLFNNLLFTVPGLPGKPTKIEVSKSPKGKTHTVIIKPVSKAIEMNLLYNRWVKAREKETDEVSGGKIGYVHVKGMDSESFRKVYSKMLGKYRDKDAIVVDTRFNGGGWLHDDLATLLSGKVYCTFAPRGHSFGTEPLSKWNKPSAVLISEGNYSDASAFPYVYRTLKLGPLVGMPVPGTMTAVWWETLQDQSLVFGIPQIGVKDLNGNYLEGQQIEPDYKQPLDKDVIITGVDQQLRKAIEVLLKK